MLVDFNRGWFVDKADKSIFIVDFAAEKKGTGEGTARFRHIVSRSLQPDVNGKIVLDAAKSSDIFWLKMGFLPVGFGPGTILYGEQAMKDLSYYVNGCPYSDVKESAKTILAAELNKPTTEIGDDELQKNQALLRRIAVSGTSAIDCFAMKLTGCILKKRKAEKIKSLREVNTLDCKLRNGQFVRMQLSDEGRNRWQEAISQNKAFQPFRDLSHLLNAIHNREIKTQLQQALEGL